MAASGQGQGRPRPQGPRGGVAVSHPVRSELVPVLCSASLSYFSFLCSSGRRQLQEGERARTRGRVSRTHVLKEAPSLRLGPRRKERLPGPPSSSAARGHLPSGSCYCAAGVSKCATESQRHGVPVSSRGSRCRDSVEGPRPSVRGGLPPAGPPGATVSRKNRGRGARQLYLANTLFIN